jgi:hypothetical protein
MQVLATVLRGGGEVLTGAPLGWGGDRFRVYRSGDGPAMVWYVAFDDATSASRFLRGTGARLNARTRPAYRRAIEPASVAGGPGARVVIAPETWDRWGSLPTVR